VSRFYLKNIPVGEIYCILKGVIAEATRELIEVLKYYFQECFQMLYELL
jgi:hypothetical protein